MATQASQVSGMPITALPDSGTPAMQGGVVALEQSATVQSQFSGVTITPTKTFSFPWRGGIVEFRLNQSVPVEADLHTALTAAGAPFTTP